MSRKRTALAALATVALLAGCTGTTEEPTPTAAPTSAAPATTSAPTPPSEEEIRAANVETGYEAIEDYYADLDTIRRGAFRDETLISRLLDSLGPNFRQSTWSYIETGQAQKWSQTGSYRVVPMGEQEYSEESGYVLMVLRTCLDVSGVEFFVDGEQIETEDHVIDYTVYISDGEDTGRIDGGAAVEDAACPAN